MAKGGALMAFHLNSVLSEMADAIKKSVADETGKIGGYADMMVSNGKTSLFELAQARLANEISDQDFHDEVEREKMVVRAELLTLEIMSKAMAQKTVDTAMNVFVKAVKLAI
jgi:hypothetical protein